MDFSNLLKNLKGLVTPTQKSPIPGEGHVNPIQNAVSKVGDFFEPKSYTHSERWGTPSPTPMPSATPTPRNFGSVLGAMTPERSNAPRPTPTLIPEAPENPHMEILKKYFPPDQVNNASNVMFRESGFRPDAIGHNTDAVGSKDYGAFQINDYWQRYNLEKKGLTPEDLLDIEENIRYAAEMQAQQGWDPWYGADALGLTSRSGR